MASLKIKGGTVVTMNEGREVLDADGRPPRAIRIAWSHNLVKIPGRVPDTWPGLVARGPRVRYRLLTDHFPGRSVSEVR